MKNMTDDLALISRYSRKPLTEEQVYIFNVTLCDNEIDRDFERFTKKALDELQPLFEGKTGIFDHSVSSSKQTARIFKTWVETDKMRKTSLGEPYSCLRACAYMVRTKDNEALIAEIEGGIKKEVSVGCSMQKINCSICGRDMKTHACEHIKGKTYASKLCFGILEQPNDAYEWSFVAVPSQREAGVTKSFKTEEKMENPIDVIKSASSEVTLSKMQTKQLCDYICSLESEAKYAKAYRKKLFDEIRKYALTAIPLVNIDEFIEGCKPMNAERLQALRDGLEKQCKQMFPSKMQLKPLEKRNENANSNNEFKI